MSKVKHQETKISQNTLFMIYAVVIVLAIILTIVTTN